MNKYEFLEIEIIRVDDVITTSYTPGGSQPGDNEEDGDGIFDSLFGNSLLG